MHGAVGLATDAVTNVAGVATNAVQRTAKTFDAAVENVKRGFLAIETVLEHEDGRGGKADSSQNACAASLASPSKLLGAVEDALEDRKSALFDPYAVQRPKRTSLRSYLRDSTAEKLSPEAAPQSSVVIRSGWLSKRAVSGVLRVWRRRYIVLTPKYIAWYRSDAAGTKPAGWLWLQVNGVAAEMDLMPRAWELLVHDARLALE